MANVLTDLENWWNDLFTPKNENVAGLNQRALQVTQMPEFQSAWPGWTSDYKTSTKYPSNSTSTMPASGTNNYYDTLFSSLTGDTNTTMTPYQQGELDYWNQKLLVEQEQAKKQLEQQAAESAADQSYRQQQIALQQQQMAQEQARYQAQLEAEKQQRLATLAANPKSWLEYAATAGQVPVIQPWMMPLMPQDYGITSVGTEIPGYNQTNMTGMPNLITPSAQLQARMGPTANQQYYGYQQAQQGATPEETQFRLWSMAPPSGSNRGLNYNK